MKKTIKIMIIEVNFIALCSMFRLARDAGYEVQGVLVVNDRVSDANLTCTDNPEHIIAAVRSFKPDVVFLEHDLRLGASLTGRYFAHRLDLSREILVGTSIHDQSYCGVMMHEKTRLDKNPVSRHTFLITIRDLLEKATQPA